MNNCTAIRTGRVLRPPSRHRPQTLPLPPAQSPNQRPPSLLEAIDGLSLAVNQLLASLGPSALETAPAHVPANATPQPPTARPAIACPWYDELTPAPVPAVSAERIQMQDLEQDDDFWSCPWDELSVQELRSLLRDYPIDRSSLPAPIELLRRSELLEALSQLQEICD